MIADGKKVELTPPEAVLRLMTMLRNAGYQAYLVGGCVRDSLLGLEPKDYDLCTDALPEEMQRVFRGLRQIETGMKHGTLTVLSDGIPFEVTTFRVDGLYTDHRHPDGVRFVTDVREDLARRDFTVNAMAWSPWEGLVDAFGGCGDLKAGCLRCVGAPEARFEEDALRMLRALRFAAVYGFAVEPQTAAEIHKKYPEMQDVAAERIRVELSKLLTGIHAGVILREYTDVMTWLLPELKECVGFDQHTPYHRYDVWEHTIRSVEAVPRTEVLRMTMLMHDSGKPACFTRDADGIGHMFGHAAVSVRLAEAAMERLRFDHQTRDRVLALIARHDVSLTGEPALMTRRLNQMGEQGLRDLIEVQRADRKAKGTVSPEEADAWADGLIGSLEQLLAQKPCFTLRQLAVSGKDLIHEGIQPGKALGQILDTLLEAVMDGEIPNEKEPLLQRALQISKTRGK